ncbi:16S rRNA (guanine(966)-N(2))-methyltransferase RsmD [Ponticoccus sp. SC2-23]|uniref:16S rRNA (guanine(966)-N(2))-methyltransferase RsmD n=1 Tax=Alexandriicola marinus TaxID=2081710 RepID=UPI000FDCAB3D|nr:16S rRNA (guanine(966)-N(2))-methyltransferase RsmD [Alexandriicola marinus]MBM1221916.1 16S rRNA (guanine(966)-N(2))-methyltransferase RsmD [Ponticoccus sp. SC6-9]MBM1226267.1 16S rRNA (guanine(966)-N(2))-methyltransferase RsmD [Ponticoccus sp. SC6-15]MBM1230863.1 16S rRNA (guanine(966)-N(2))-methyltransferase RsmD [Ponticoccus sp. SC6-38]MBM1235296.1 16S rRNA (guanine(966)-N(2))-methyltransferase RsmD [Ponticoccus sp. SC6-45]MBM1239885.1 16S rRNA (guanine(966)-N(2))-methyltransferase RsmD
MRIIAGRHRGLTLAAVGVGDKGASLRPTSDRVREALFNVLTGGRFGDPVTGAHVLDLFAGTGALGLEALSRGAAHATFVDDGRVAQNLIRQNLRRAGRDEDARVLKVDVRSLPTAEEGADLVFLDPPYAKGLGAPALGVARAQGWIAPGAVVVWEERSPQPPPAGFSLIEHRRYGDAHLTFLKADPS